MRSAVKAGAAERGEQAGVLGQGKRERDDEHEIRFRKQRTRTCHNDGTDGGRL